MTTPSRATCRSCGAPILWVVSAASGKAMPVDADPVEDGNVTLDGLTATVHPAGQGDLLGDAGPRYRSHFATCKDADEWRRS